MDHMLSRAEGQRVRYVREWRSVVVHQPSASSLRMLAGALLLMSLALGVLALIVIAALPLLGAWRTGLDRPLVAPPRAPHRETEGADPTGFGLPGPAFVPSGRRVRPPLAHDAGRSGGTAYDRRVVG